MVWYTARDGQRQGPLSEDIVREMARTGELRPRDLVWQTGDSSRKEARTIPGLIPNVQEPPPVPGAPESLMGDAVTTRETQAEPAPEAPPSKASPSTAPPEANYFVRHWRGDLSLPISYWVNGFLATIAVLALTALVSEMDWTEGPRRAALASGSVLLFALAASLWQMVGIWRSAENHPSRGGSKGWATAAKFMVVIGFLRFAVSMNEQVVPQLGVVWQVLSGDKQFSGYTLRVMRDASELEVSGPIGFGLTKDVARTLDAQPSITTIHLNSNGGRVNEAQKLANLIRERGLSTHVAGECASACTVALMGGVARTMEPRAKLGFHRFTVNGLDSVASETMNQDGRAFYEGMGMSRAFADRVFETLPTDMWHPTSEELIAGRVITEIATEGQFAMSGFTRSGTANLEEQLLRMDLFKALKQYEPEAYAAMVPAILDAAQRGRSINELRAQLMPETLKVYSQRLPHGDDASVIALTKVMVKQMQALNAQEGNLCLRYVDASDSSVEIAAKIPKELRDEEGELMDDLIRSAATGIYGPAPGPDFDRIVKQLVSEMAAQWGDDIQMLAALERPEMIKDPKKACALLIDMYERILQLPPAKAGTLLRTLYDS